MYIHAVGTVDKRDPQNLDFSMIHGCGIYISLMSSRFCKIGVYKREPVLHVVAVTVPVAVTTQLPARVSS
jgi:hypothetical protein